MKIFISYSEKDIEFALWLKDQLLKEGDVQILFDEEPIEMGMEFRYKLRELRNVVDYYIIIVSKYSIKSKFLRLELDNFIFEEIKSEKQTIIPIALDEYAYEYPILPEISRRKTVNFFKSKELGLKSLLKILRQTEKPKISIKEINSEEIKKLNDNHLRDLHSEFKKGNLCLFCGAGISIEAGIPNWNFLLKGLLQNLVDKHLGDINLSPTKQRELAEFYYDEFGVSSLIVGQYLKNGLGDSFLISVRDALYVKNPSNSDILKAIVELCRPQRERKSLNSIISFNFDDLIEENLTQNNIKHKAIYSEGQRAASTEIPVYHPHGFLPRNGNLTKENEIVFSEDAYHSQFIEPFSWSNLVQLNHLNSNTCLLVGISLTDPNLRRLLDVSMRKNPEKSLRHYIFKRRYNHEEIYEKLDHAKLDTEKSYFTKNLIYMTELLEEQDARTLGLNVIWVNDFNEITRNLAKLTDE